MSHHSILSGDKIFYYTQVCCTCVCIYVVHMCEGACVCIGMGMPEADVEPSSPISLYFVEAESLS